MKRVVNFYEKLPQGPAPEVKATGILGRYQAKHFGKNPSAKRKCYGDISLRGRVGYVMLTMPGDTAIIHALVFLVAVGYAQNYYFHLRKFNLGGLDGYVNGIDMQLSRSPQEQCSLE